MNNSTRSHAVTALMVRNLESTLADLTQANTAHPSRARQKQIEAVKREIEETREA